jgi:hypothetical protein
LYVFCNPAQCRVRGKASTLDTGCDNELAGRVCCSSQNECGELLIWWWRTGTEVIEENLGQYIFASTIQNGLPGGTEEKFVRESRSESEAAVIVLPSVLSVILSARRYIYMVHENYFQ